MALVDDRALLLDPHQLAVLARVHTGPALLAGRPGTGKSVVARHRLAARPAGRLLYLAPTRALARAQAAAYRLLGGPIAEFATIGEWTADLALRWPGRCASPYDFVVVDEAQALTPSELRLVHRHAGDNLLLVSAAPPASWLPGTGIVLDGRVDTLWLNYRNSAAVLGAARAYERDLGPQPGASGGRAGTALRYLAACPDDQDAELVAAVRGCPVAPADTALLTAGRAGAAYYRRMLHAAQIPAVGLGEHPGLQVGAVQVGPVAQAKGLEFGAVFLPDARAGSAADTLTAVTRAREYVWTGNVLNPGRHA